MAEEDPLCRGLTTGEQQWLSQSSLICIVARLSSHEMPDEDCLLMNIQKTRANQPYLSIAVDTNALKFKRSECIPFTSEAVSVIGDESNIIKNRVSDQLALGINREVSFGRVHLIKTDKDSAYIIVIGDHLCLDGRSLMWWISELVKNPVAREESGEDVIPSMLDFIDWTLKIPSIKFTPFEPPFQSIKLKSTQEVPSMEVLISESIQDVIVKIEAITLQTLKEVSKSRGLTLNAPLQIAFLAAMTDAALLVDESLCNGYAVANVRGVSAVDVRSHLGLSSAYMNNSASVVPIHSTFPIIERINPLSSPSIVKVVDDSKLWFLADNTQKVLMDNIEAGEAYRLHDITQRGAYAEFVPYFDILCLWSNMGVVGSSAIEAAVVHLKGAATNPIVSGHPITTTNGELNLTLSYSPGFHERSTIQYAGERFLHHIEQLASSSLA